MVGLSYVRYLFLFLVAATALGCDRGADYRSLSGQTMGTTWSVKYKALARPDHAVLQQDIQTILDNVNGQMSTYQDNSELSVVNRAEVGQWQRVSGDLFRVIETARQINKDTEGVFDITVGPLVNLWGFGPDEPQGVPTANQIKNARTAVDMNLLQSRAEDNSVRRLSDRLYVDLSAIAKGFAVDQVADFLSTAGINDYLVEVGGELRVAGMNAEGIPWHVAIEKPVAGLRSVQKVLPLTDISIATSGDYRNYFELEGRRYSHAIDPRTGWPVLHDLVSATVLHPSCMMADAWATAMIVLGYEAAVEMAERQNLAVLLIRKTSESDQAGQYAEWLSSAMAVHINTALE